MRGPLPARGCSREGWFARTLTLDNAGHVPERRPLALTLQAAFAALAVALVVFAAGPGCIFFVGDANGLQTKVCPFQGSTTPCGQCIAEFCQPKVDACCASSDCRDSLTNLDSCATSGTQLACSTLMTGISLNGSTAFNTLGSCTTQCSTQCNGTGTTAFGPDAAVGSTYSLACSASDDSCFCEATSVPTPVVCGASMFQDGICCADWNYPSTGGCTCSVANTCSSDQFQVNQCYPLPG